MLESLAAVRHAVSCDRADRTRRAAVVRLVGLFAAVAATGCVLPPPPPGAAGGPPGWDGAPARPEPAELALARLGSSALPGPTLARSRLLRALGRHGEAVRQLDAAIDGARDRLDWRALGDLWRELGDVQVELAQPQRALESYARRLTNAGSLDLTRDRAFAQVDMAYAFVLLSQWTPAQHALEDAELLAGAELAGDPASLEKMAHVRDKLLARELAIGLFAQARAGYARRGDATGEARAAIAGAYLEALATERAAPLDGARGRALDDLVARADDPEPAIRLLRYRGEAALRFDHHHERCLAIAERGLAPAVQRGIPAVVKAMNILISVCAGKLGQVERAVAAAERAAAIAEEEWQRTAVPSARQAVGFEALLLYRHILALDVKLPEPERAAAAFAAMEKARGRAHVDAAIRAGAGLRATSVEPPPLLALNKRELEAHLVELNQQIAVGHADPVKLARRRDAMWALDDVQAAIAHHSPLITRVRTPRPVDLARARQLLDDRTVMLAFLMTSEQAVAVAVTRSVARLVVVDGDPASLAARIAQFRDHVIQRAPLDELRGQAGALYGALLAPVADLLARHDRLIILPHGALAPLPFEALVDASGRFVAQTHEVSYHQSATLALEDAEATAAVPRASARAADRTPFAGMGDPVYDWPAFAAGRAEGVPLQARELDRYAEAIRVARSGRGAGGPPGARTGLERLPGTARELTAIAALFGGDARLYLRDQASEENAKSGVLGQARIVHIASHGLFETDYQALALTMRPGAREDGFLLQRELAELRLAADLVVLSACETGRAHAVLAEPVSGLALALRTAGARRMIASLWSVDDSATVELMTAFYAPIATAAMPYGAALAQAKRALLASPRWQHPFYWAPFILVGNR